MIRPHLVFILLATLSCQVAKAQFESLEIGGPRTVTPGQLVRLDAQLAIEESPFWIVLSPTNLDYEQVDDGSRLIFAIDCGQTEPITIMLLAQRFKDGRILTRQTRRTLTINETVPTPSPDNGQADSERERFEQSPLFGAVTLAWESISSPAAQEKTEAVAGNFEQIAARCETGSIKTLPEVWQRLSESNQSVLAEFTAEWAPVGLAMQQGFQQLHLKTLQEHSFHLRAIASALRSKLK